MRRLASFGPVSAADRREADLFFAELTGTPAPQPSGPRWRGSEAIEQAPSLQLGPLSEGEWRNIIYFLTVGEAQVGVPLTADAGANAINVAARIFCDRNALWLWLQGDPLICLIPQITARDPRVLALVHHVTARGPLVLWQQVPMDERIRQTMALLVGNHGYPVHGAAGLVGNLLSESGLLPSRVEGSAAATPMRAKGFAGRTVDFTADDIVHRSRAARRGPRLPGVGLAQWTTPDRRAGLFQHTFRGVVLGPRILFDLEAQVDYLVAELRTPALARVDAVLRGRGVSLDAASDEVLYNFEIPGAILEGGRKLPRTDPRVQAVFRVRRSQSARALRVHEAAAARSQAAHLGERTIEMGSSPEVSPTMPPTVVEVVGRGQAHFTFVPITSRAEIGGQRYSARFWVLDDALKWIVPRESSPTTLPHASEFEEPTDDDVMVIKHGALRQDVRRRLWRLPCTAREAQHAADLLQTGQRELAGATAAASSSARQPSLLLTPHLYDLRFAQADLRIAPQHAGLMKMNATKGLLVASVEYNRRVNREAKRVLDSGGTGPRRHPELLADPGKIWAITHDIGTVRTTTCENPPRPTRFRFAVNYGWHQPSGGKILQDQGRCHDAAHSDYSQILVVVAGWCELTRPGASGPVWIQTATVYTSAELGPLVTGGGPALAKIRYDW